MGNFRSVMGTLYKAYIYKTLYRDGSRFLKRTFDDIDLDLDKKALLHKIGLTPYTPVKRTIGGISFFLVGAAIGAAIGAVLAPKPGVQLRQEVKEKAMDLLGRSNETPIERRVHA